MLCSVIVSAMRRPRRRRDDDFWASLLSEDREIEIEIKIQTFKRARGSMSSHVIKTKSCRYCERLVRLHFQVCPPPIIGPGGDVVCRGTARNATVKKLPVWNLDSLRFQINPERLLLKTTTASSVAEEVELSGLHI